MFARWRCAFGRSGARVMAVHEAVHSAARSTAGFIGVADFCRTRGLSVRGVAQRWRMWTVAPGVFWCPEHSAVAAELRLCWE